MPAENLLVGNLNYWLFADEDLSFSAMIYVGLTFYMFLLIPFSVSTLAFYSLELSTDFCLLFVAVICWKPICPSVVALHCQFITLVAKILYLSVYVPTHS